MKPNELMIGDWVQHRDEFNEVTGPYKIDLISKYEIGFENETYARSFNNEIEPIPLTAEILEKNGFKKDTGGEECWANSKGWFTPHEYGKRDTIKSWEVEICGKINSFDGVIKYVHELQHALKLCGINKTIEV